MSRLLVVLVASAAAVRLNSRLLEEELQTESSLSPTPLPTPVPTALYEPTTKPTYHPTGSQAPTPLPTPMPTAMPTSIRPSFEPTTKWPTTLAPSYHPTTLMPSHQPTTPSPTVSPTTSKPTLSPTTETPTTAAPTTAHPSPVPTTAYPTMSCDESEVNVRMAFGGPWPPQSRATMHVKGEERRRLVGADFSYSFEDVFDPEVNCDYLSELLEVWDDFALITNGDAVFSGNAIDKGIVIGGTFSRTGSHNIQVNQQSKAPSNYAGTFDADNVNYKRGTSSIFPNWYDWETFQKVAESVTDSENLYVVQNDEAADYDLYDFGDSNAQSNNNGKTLVVFLGTGDITLVKASGRDFGPSILAPFAKVIAGGSLGEVNGFIVADSFEHLGSSGFSISGKGYKNEIACAPTTSPTSAPTPFYVFNVDPATTTSENICLNYPECYQMEMTTRVGSSSLTSRISTALTTIETTADEEFVSTSFCLDDSGEIELAPTHAPTLQPTESQMPTPMPSTAVPSPAPTQATSVNVVSGTMCLGGGCGGSTSTEDLRRRRRLEEEEPDAEDYQEALLAVCVDEALAVVFSNVTEDAFANETGFFAPGTELSQIDAVCTINVTLPDETPILSFTCEIETLRDETHKIDGRRIASAEIEAGLTDAFEKVAVGNDEFSDLIIAAIRSNEDESCTNNLLISTTPTNSIEVLELIEEAEVEAIEVAVETANPTSVPTSAPSEVPSPAPTYVPTPVPTTEMPTPETPYPTEMPTTYAPSILPTSIPTMLPTYDPTRMPTSAAPTPETPYPTVSKAPSGLPTPAPTILPTYLPTYAPTHYSPTNPPNIQPSYSPTESPTNVECNEDEDCPGDYVCEISGSRRRRRRRKMLLGYSIGICVLPED